MNNKLNNLINEFMANTKARNEEELNKELGEFLKKYNNGEIEYTDTPLDKSYELLEKAEMAKTKSQAIKLAQQAYNTCSECFDAILFLVDIEENLIKKWKILNDGLEFEKNRLEKEKYFDKDNIGHFYGIYETRPYIRGLYSKAEFLIIDGKIKQARDVCKEIIKLNENDNLGARYLLMAIYAYLEEEKDMLKLYKKYNEDNLEMLFPLFINYYKKGDDNKAKEYLDMINKVNPNLIKFFKGTMKKNKNVPDGHYAIGDSSEVMMYFVEYRFLLLTMPTLKDYILEYNKKSNYKRKSA